MICDRTDDDNPPSLPPESNMPCIQSIIGEVNEEYLFWHPHRDEEDPVDSNHASTKEEHHEDSPLPPESNNHNQDLENCYDDHYRVHSELIDSNPSMIPNDGERVVLLSSVSRVEKNVMVKKDVMSGRSRVEKNVMVRKDVMSGRLFQSIYRVDSNINLLQIVLSIFLQLECE